MANRIDEIGGIWALNAPNVPGGTPVQNVTYANTLMDEATINAAWPFSIIVASNNHNEIMRRMTILMVQMEQQGILSYSVLTDYGVGALVMGSDDTLYRAIVANGPANPPLVDPVGNPGTWTGTSSGVTEVDTSGLATGGPITGTGTIDVPASSLAQAQAGTDNTTAMTPLRTKQAIAASPTATTTVRGVVEKSTSAENLAGTATDVYPDVFGVSEMIGQIPPSPGSLWTESGSDIYRPSDNVGIGIVPVGAKLDVNGQVKIRGGSPGAGKVLTSDALGIGSWVTPTPGGASGWVLIEKQSITNGVSAEIQGLLASYNVFAVSVEVQLDNTVANIAIRFGDSGGIRDDVVYQHMKEKITTDAGTYVNDNGIGDDFILIGSSTTQTGRLSAMFFVTRAAFGISLQGSTLEKYSSWFRGGTVFGVYANSLAMDRIQLLADQPAVIDSGTFTVWGIKDT